VAFAKLARVLLDPPIAGSSMPLQTGSCAICGGTGFVVRRVKGYDRAASCACRQGTLHDRQLVATGIPARFRHCRLDNYEIHHESQIEARKRAQDFVLGYPPEVPAGLLFSGPCGVGKTHLAVGILHSLVEGKGVPGLFIDFRDLLKKIQETYSPSNQLSASQVIRPILQAEVLVLDDLGAAKMTDWVRDTLGHIINQRYNEERITLFTTHFSDSSPKHQAESTPADENRLRLEVESLAQRIGTPLRSRLDEMCRLVPLRGHDYRRTFLRAADR
jgi:DNA replication protein DnaC